MTIQIYYKNSGFNKTSKNLVLFVDEKFNIKPIKNQISNSDFLYISDLLKISDLKKNLFVFEINSKKKIVLISVKKDLKNSDIENLGAQFYDLCKSLKQTEYYLNSNTISSKDKRIYLEIISQDT